MQLDNIKQPAQSIIVLIILISLFISVAGFLAYPLVSINLYYERLYNEGYNLYHATRLARGENIFEQNPWAPNNYPFLSFYVTVLLGKLSGSDLLFVGRWLSVAGLLGMAVGLYAAIRSLGCVAWEALLGTAVAVGLIFVIDAAPWVAANDPQFLGQGLAMLGMAIYLRKPDRAWRLVAAAGLMIVAGFVKHNLIAVPLAVGLDLLWRSRRDLVLWLASAAVAGGVMLLLQRLVAGPDFGAAVFGGPRVLVLKFLTAKVRWIWQTAHIPLATAVLAALASRPAPGFYRLFLGASLAEVALFAAGDGVSFNILLELVVAVGMGCAMGLSYLRQVGAGFRFQLALAVMVAIPIHLAALDWLRRIPGVHSDSQMVAAQFEADMAWLSARPGEVICESILLCLEAGHDLVMDPFNARQMILARRLDDGELLRKVDAQQFSVIQLRAPIILDEKGQIATPTFLSFERFTPQFLLAVAAQYRIGRDSGSRVFYVPKAIPAAPQQ